MTLCSDSSCYDGFPRQRRLDSSRRWDGGSCPYLPISHPYSIPSLNPLLLLAPQPQRPCGHHVAGTPVTLVRRSPVTMGVPVRKGVRHRTGRYRGTGYSGHSYPESTLRHQSIELASWRKLGFIWISQRISTRRLCRT